jgi:hypothetical protein
MTAVTASGCEIRVKCDPPWKRVMWEWARWAIASSEAAVMIEGSARVCQANSVKWPVTAVTVRVASGGLAVWQPRCRLAD